MSVLSEVLTACSELVFDVLLDVFEKNKDLQKTTEILKNITSKCRQMPMVKPISTSLYEDKEVKTC